MGLWRKDDTFLDEVDFDIQLVDSDIVLQVAIKPVGFFDKEDATNLLRAVDFRLLQEELDHFIETGASGHLRRFDVHVIPNDLELLPRGVVFEQLRLGGNRVALLFLFL
ncbi:MAG: hypothetical protein OSA98_15775 [Rubripirellula sp.]|nr:hypothetical protein [Rubripirellula sp.]